MHSQGEVIFKLTSKTQISKVARRGLCIQRATNGDSGQNYMPFLDQRLSYAMGFSDGVVSPLLPPNSLMSDSLT